MIKHTISSFLTVTNYRNTFDLDEDALEGKMWKYVESPAHEMDESGFEEFDSSFEQMEEGYKYTQELFYIYSRSNVYL